MKIRSLLTLSALCAAATVGSAQYVISEATGLFAPSFREEANTTWFGWSSGTFFGTPVPASSSRILNNIAPTLGNVGLADGVEFYQDDYAASTPVIIGASSGNIYTGQGAIGKQASATLVAPTDGIVGTGYTTIIIQGVTTTSGMGGPSGLIANPPIFGDINGVEAEFIIGVNGASQGQWWAKYEIFGNEADYTFDITFNGGTGTSPISIAGLTVDTYWNAEGFASVSASAVPEPSSFAALAGLATLGAAALRRRRRA